MGSIGSISVVTHQVVGSWKGPAHGRDRSKDGPARLVAAGSVVGPLGRIFLFCRRGREGNATADHRARARYVRSGSFGTGNVGLWSQAAVEPQPLDALFLHGAFQ